MRLSTLLLLASATLVTQAYAMETPTPAPMRPSAQLEGHSANKQIAPALRATAAANVSYPDMRLQHVGGESLMLSDRINFFFDQGKPFLILHFWATWCANCIEELQYFSAQSYAARQDTTNTLAPVITVALEQNTPEHIADFLKNKAHAPYADAFTASLNDAVTCCQTRGLPLTIFINKDGTEFRRIEGAYPWDAPGAFVR